MQFLGFKPWSWCWIPGGAHAEVTNPSPPWFGCVQHFLLVGRQDDAEPGNRAGSGGNSPWSLRARVQMASLILAKGKEMQHFFRLLKPILKASWAKVQVCVPLGQLAFWICQPSCKKVKMMRNIWCNESTPKLKKKNLTDCINQKLFTVIFPLLILWIFFIVAARTNFVSRIRAVILVVMSLQILFLLCWRDCKCSTPVIACKSCSEVHCRASKKELNSASVKTSNWFSYKKKKNPQPKAVRLSLEDKKKPRVWIWLPSL